MSLDTIYKQYIPESHEAALQAVYDKGFADATAGALASGLAAQAPLTSTYIPTLEVVDPGVGQSS